jgi:hypothetical protein
MEGSAMTFVSVNPHGLLFGSPSNDASWFSLSRSCAQMADSDIIVRLKGLYPAMIRTRYDHEASDIIHLFLDFNENIPHSSAQDNAYDD